LSNAQMTGLSSECLRGILTVKIYDVFIAVTRLGLFDEDQTTHIIVLNLIC